MKFAKWFEEKANAYFEELNKERTLNGNSVSWQGDTFSDAEVVLISAIQNFEKLNYEALKIAVRRAMSAPVEKLEASQWLKDLAKAYFQILHSTKNEYVILAGVYIKPALPFKRLNYNCIRIETLSNATSKRDKKFLKNHWNRVNEVTKGESVSSTTPTQWVKIFIKADNPILAVQLAWDEFDEVRGLLNFVFNRTKISKSGWSTTIAPQEPLNEVQVSKFRTVHNSTGKLATHTVWFTRDWVAPKKLPDLGANDGVRTEWFNQCLKRLRTKHALADTAKQALRLYCRALDTPNWKVSFLDLWSVLEILTMQTRRESHDSIVTKVANVYEDDFIPTVHLHHLREVRNAMVHSGFDPNPEDIRKYLYQLNREVCTFFQYIITNSLGFKDDKEAREFFSTKRDLKTIERKIGILQKYIEFQNT